MRFIGRRERRRPRACVERMEWAEETTAANERITLFVAFNYGGRAEIVDAARSFEGGVRGRVPRPALRARDARPRPPDPDQRRAADLELPALAVRLLGARLQRRALARLRPRGVRGGAGRVRDAAAGGSEGAAMEGSRPFDSELDFDQPRRSRASRTRRRCAAARRAAGGDGGPKRDRSETLARIAWAIPWIAIVVTIAIVGGELFAAAMIGFACVGICRVLPHDARRAALRDGRLRRRRRRSSPPPSTATSSR